jgi:hypothetical protein
MYTSLNAIMIKLHYKPFSLQKDETHGQYTMRPSEQRFTIFILYCIYIFKIFLSTIFLYFLSLKRYLFKHRRVSTSTKWDFALVYLSLQLIISVSPILEKQNDSDN